MVFGHEQYPERTPNNSKYNTSYSSILREIGEVNQKELNIRV